MRDLSPGWATDLGILELNGSTLERHDDHVVVRTPHNPDYHWGNFLLVTDSGAVDDPHRWLETFHVTFPEATWIAIGLPRTPEAVDAWVACGVGIELNDVLTTRALPRQTHQPDGYTVRRLTGSDWEQQVARAMAENSRTGDYEPVSHERFERAQAKARRGLCDRDVAAYFGAFADDVLVAELGIVCCETTARYQDVGTEEDHRGRGLASHLLGVAARWSADRGCDQWVIVTETTNPAGRVYRRAGFEPDSGNVQVYRRPPR